MADPGPITGPLKRLNYFKYQFLNAQDFVDEQAYHRRLLWAHNQALHSPGVASGLEVRPGTSSGTLLVTSGTAIDGYGRELILQQDATWSIPSGATALYLTLRYDELPTDEVSTPDATDFMRTQEAPVIASSTSPPAGPADVLLAYVTIDAGGAVTIDAGGTNRQRAGSLEGDLTLRPPDPAVTAPQWVRMTWSAPNQAALAGSLQLVAPPNGPASNLSVSGGAQVAGATTLSGALTVAGASSLSTLAVSGVAALNGTLNVAGATTLRGNVALQAPATLTVAGATSLNGAVTAPAGLTVGTALVVNAPATVNGTLAASGNATVGGTLGVAGATTLAALTASGLTVTGAAGFNSSALVGTSLTVDSANANAGLLAPGLLFGNAGQEGISSRRTGGNQFGLDFWTRAAVRLTIMSTGAVGIGTGSGGVAAGNMLDVRGQVGVMSVSGPGLVFNDATGAAHPTNWIGMANNIDGAKRFLHVGGITDTGASGDNLRRIALMGDRVYLSGNLGIGVVNPADRLSVAGNMRLAGDYQLTTGRSMLLMGRTDGSNSAADELLGGIGFMGSGIQHGQLSFRAGRGFEFVDRSGDGPGLNYGWDSHPYANVKMNALTLASNLTLPATGQINAPGRLHITGDEVLYLLNKNGVIVGKEWGGTGALSVEGWLQAGTATMSTTGIISVFGHNVHYDQNNWQWHDTSKPSWMIYPYTYSGGGALYIYSTTATNTQSWATRMYIDSNTGVTYIYGDLHVTGALYSPNKSGFVSDQFVNALNEPLEAGDVVVVGSSQVSQFWGENDTVPIPEVDLTDTAYDGRVFGVVAEVHGSPEPPAEHTPGEGSPAPLAAGPEDRTKVPPGQIGLAVTLGAFARCKVDADIAPIGPGDLLTTSPTRGHAQKVLDPAQAQGAIIGKALGSLDKGRGTVPILVTLH